MTYPNTGMVISSDLGGMTHPLNKSGYGKRASDVALGMTYGKPVEYYGPIFSSHTVEGNAVRVYFKHVGKGLAVRHSDRLQGFTIAGEDGKFYWADAKLDGDSVVVSSAGAESESRALRLVNAPPVGQPVQQRRLARSAVQHERVIGTRVGGIALSTKLLRLYSVQTTSLLWPAA
ncbi:MAG: hypothetical protein QM775_28695 [Pirellulales bacterium]